MIVSPDEGALNRNMYYASALGVELGMFYKRRDYSRVVDGRNPIVAHEYLGSDVAGGQTLDLFTVMATAVQVSKLRWRYIDQSEKPLTMGEALYMATVGGGNFWADFGEKVGLFEDGYAFDALVLDDDPLKNMRAFSAAERLERYAYLGKGKLTAKFAAGEKLL